MYFFSSFIVAVSTAMIAPGISSTIQEAEPIPLRPAVILEQPSTTPETKPLPSIAPTVKESACNCYNILKENFERVPAMRDIVATASASIGNVAVFKYPATPDWPTGIPHVALVRNVLPDGSIQIEEYNYHRCTHSFRTISPSDHRLVGFVTL